MRAGVSKSLTNSGVRQGRLARTLSSRRSRFVGGRAPNRRRSDRRRGCRHDRWCGKLIVNAEGNPRPERSSMIYKRIGHWHLDVTIHGVRYREALNTTDKRQAKELEKNRIAEIKQGKNASKTGREFARKPFCEGVPRRARASCFRADDAI